MVLVVLIYQLIAQVTKEHQPNVLLLKELMEHRLVVIQQAQHLQQIVLSRHVPMRILEEQLHQLQTVLVGYKAAILMERITVQLMIAQNILELKPLVGLSQQQNQVEIHKPAGK